MRLKGKTTLSGTDFKRPDGSKFSSPESGYVNQVPNQVRYTFQDFTFGTMIIDRLRGTGEKLTGERYNQIDKQDAPHL